jgi:serine/threonine protein kinase
MSPEQVRGEKLDARSDLFSFGLVLYEMATGHRAFVGDSGPVVQAAILNQSPAPVRELNPKFPTRLDRIINKALERNRETRYQTAAEMRADIERLKRDLGGETFRSLGGDWHCFGGGDSSGHRSVDHKALDLAHRGLSEPETAATHEQSNRGPGEQRGHFSQWKISGLHRR